MLRRCSHTKAFTLLELLVTISLLGMMVGIVANVLSQSSKLVTFTETRIRQNNAAASLAMVFRDMLRRASRDGILSITDSPDTPAYSRMILTTVGPSPSITGVGKGDAAFTVLGLVTNNAVGADANVRLLWMPTRVLVPRGDSNFPDIWNIDFATYQGYTRRQINDNIIQDPRCIGTSANNTDLSNLKVPPVTIGDVNLLWQVAATGVSRLTILWTDGNMAGTTPDSLNWYGNDFATSTSRFKDNNWKNRTLSTFNLDDPNSIQAVEYNAGSTGAPIYRVLWTQANQNYWPRAIKIRFTFTDDSMPPDFQNVDYEVIGTIGQ